MERRAEDQAGKEGVGHEEAGHRVAAETPGYLHLGALRAGSQVRLKVIWGQVVEGF